MFCIMVQYGMIRYGTVRFGTEQRWYITYMSGGAVNYVLLFTHIKVWHVRFLVVIPESVRNHIHWYVMCNKTGVAAH